jgi:hypothetical protein
MSNPIRGLEGELGDALSVVERILVRVAVFAVFVVGLYEITARLLHA